MSPAHDEHEDAFQARLDLGLWRRILSHARPYRPILITLAGFGVALAAIESYLPLVTGQVIDRAAEIARTREPGSTLTAGDFTGLWWYCGLYLALITLIAIAIRTFIVLAGKVATGVA